MAFYANGRTDTPGQWLPQLFNSTPASTTSWPPWHNQLIIHSTGGIGGTQYTSSQATTSGTIYYWPVWHDNIAAPAIVHDEAHWQQMREQQAIARQRHAEQEQKDKAIQARAREIMLQHLTPQQREMVERNNWFIVAGGKSGKRYRIHANLHKVAGNVELLDAKEEKALARFCCHLQHQYPSHDHHLAQKLMLEWDEDTFLHLANRTSLAA